MSAMHPSRGWKGCPMCKYHKVRGQGAEKVPVAVKRQVGRKRKMNRWREDQ